jgi:hypothetical protein
VLYGNRGRKFEIKKNEDRKMWECGKKNVLGTNKFQSNCGVSKFVSKISDFIGDN